MAVKKLKWRGKQGWRARVVYGGKTAVAYCSRKDDALEAEAKLHERLKLDAGSEATGLPQWGEKAPTLSEFVDEVEDPVRCDRKAVYTVISCGKPPGVREFSQATRIYRQRLLDWLGANPSRSSGS